MVANDEHPLSAEEWFRRMAPNSFKSAASQKAGIDRNRKPAKVNAWSLIVYWRTADSTPDPTASSTARTMASTTIRRVTAARRTSSGPTSSPLTDLPRSPRAKLWIQYQ